MKIPTTIKWAAAIAAVCLAAHSAGAQNQIGVNFVADDNLIGGEQPPGGVQNGWVDSLLPTDIAGVFPQSNWNNLGRFGDSITLNDSSGASSGVSIAWTALGMWHCSGQTGFPPGPPFSDPNAKLMDGFLESTWGLLGLNGPIAPGTAVTNITDCAPIVFLSGLQQFVANQCGGPYSIVVYCNSDLTECRHSEYWVDAVTGPSSAIVVGPPITPPIFVAHCTQFDGTFTRVSPLATNDIVASDGNYIVFSGLTNNEILIVSQNISVGPAAAINGIQIIALGVRIPPTLAPPIISPTNVIFLGTTVTISDPVYVCGTPAYQWQTDGGGGGSLTNIPDATNSSVATTPTTVGTWDYDVVVTNSYGSVTSMLATVTVLPASAPILTTDIGQYNTNVYGFIGGSVSFYANFGLGTMPITNQWLFDNGTGYAPIAGAASSALTLTNVQPSSAGRYELAATNAVGRSNSTPAYLTALADPAAPASNGMTNMYSYYVYTSHPWAYWKFEETNDTLTSSMQAYDYSGHNFNATYGNSTTGDMTTGCYDGGESIDKGQYGPRFVDGYFGFPANNGPAGLQYNVANGYLTVPPLNLNTNTVTFTMWIYPNDPGGIIAPYSGLLMNRNGSDAAGVGFSGNQNANLTAALGYTWNNNSPATYGWNSHLFPPAQTWSFVAYVISPQNTTIYLYYVGNGQINMFKAVNNTPNTSEGFNGGLTWLGSDPAGGAGGARTFDGSIDEVAVFTNSLSETQIQDLFIKALGLLTVICPSITMPPTNTSVFVGQPLQMTVAGGGIPSPDWRWQGGTNQTPGNWNSSTGLVGNILDTTGGPSRGVSGAATSTITFSNYNSSFNFLRVIATNACGKVTSSWARVQLIPIPTNGIWTVNFAITTSPNGTYVGRGVLGYPGTGKYWNALSGRTFILGGVTCAQFTNTPPSLLDDGVTVSGITLGSSPIYMGAFESDGSNNALLDTYCSFVGAGAAFAFTGVPNGTYNLALYGIDGAYANLGTTFTVNGVSQSVTNAQDVVFLPDNTVVYTNLVVMNGTLAVTMVPIPRQICPVWGCPGAFNGAQLQLVQYAPQPPTITYSNGWCEVTWVGGGGLYQATNVLGPWVTNPGVPPIWLRPTGYMRFFRVYNPTWPN